MEIIDLFERGRQAQREKKLVKEGLFFDLSEVQMKIIIDWNVIEQ